MDLIENLYALVGRDGDGREGVVVLPGSLEPAIRRRYYDALELARRAQATADAVGEEYRLVHFQRVRTVRVIRPRIRLRKAPKTAQERSTACATGERRS